MKRPSFQFYVGDWQSNNKLRRCTHAEKGIWLDVMCLMHDSEEYGILRWPLKDIAQAVGCKLPDLLALFAKGVLKGVDRGQTLEPYIFTPRHAGQSGNPMTLLPEQKGPVWYSSRMVRDEYVRLKRGKGTRFGVPPIPPIGDDIGGGIGDGPSSSSSSSPLSQDLNIKTPLTSTSSPARQKESVLQKFDIRNFLSDDDLERAKKTVPGKDIYYLIERYNEGVPKRGIPDFPAPAFLAWLPLYRKDQ